MTVAEELRQLSAKALLSRLHSRALSAEAVFRACLERIELREADVGAWACVNAEQGLRRARELDAGPVTGALHGLPVGVKDIIDTYDMQTEYGSPIYAGHRPAWDAACVAAIRRAGGLILGKTVTTEFASSYPGKTRHPLAPGHTPGGSSSGSAAAVADGMVPVALGTQTGGSIIRPAGFCGIVGFKPSFGTINRHGVKPLSESLDTVGVLARNIADAAFLAAQITGRPSLSQLGLVAAPRIGVVREHAWSEAQEQAVNVMEWAIGRLAAAGATVKDARLGIDFSRLDQAHHRIEFFEMARALSFEMNVAASSLSEKLRDRLDDGGRINPDEYDREKAVARACRGVIDDAFAEFDMLLTFSAPGEAPQGLGATGSAIFNRVWTMLHLPCIAVPLPRDVDVHGAVPRGRNGLPIGIQLIGRCGHDSEALAGAAWVEAVFKRRKVTEVE